MLHKHLDFKFLICGLLSLVFTLHLSAQEPAGNPELDQLKKQVEGQLKMYEKEMERQMKVKDELNNVKSQIESADSKIIELTNSIANSAGSDPAALKMKAEQQLADTALFYQKKFSTMASNFLYLPYNKYSIEQIAIPAYEAIKGTDLYNQRAIRLQLLQSYRTDIESLIAYISDIEPKLGKLQEMFKMATDRIKNDKWSELKNSLNSLSFVKEYQKYNDWKETYLGKQYLAIAGLLGGNNPASSKASITKIKENLQSLLQDNN